MEVDQLKNEMSKEQADVVMKEEVIAPQKRLFYDAFPEKLVRDKREIHRYDEIPGDDSEDEQSLTPDEYYSD